MAQSNMRAQGRRAGPPSRLSALAWLKVHPFLLLLGAAMMVGSAGLLSCVPQLMHGFTPWRQQNQALITSDSLRFVPAHDGGTYNSPTWIPATGEVAVVYSPPGGKGWHTYLYALQPDGTGLRRLDLPDDPDCTYTSHVFPQTLPDGRLAYLQRCWVSVNPARRLPEQEVSLMVYDPLTGAVERLVPYYLPLNANYFDVSPVTGRGIINDGRGLYESLHWLLPDRLERIDVGLTRAGSPRWSPDGQFLAVDGAPESLGKRGGDRVLLPRALYLLPANGGQLKLLLEGVVQAAPSAWSPDGQWLVAPLDFSDGGSGLWQIHVASGSRRLLLAGPDVGSANWSPDGRTLVAPIGMLARFQPGNTSRVGLLFFDAPTLPEAGSSHARR